MPGVYEYTKTGIQEDYERILNDIDDRSRNTIEKLEEISRTMSRIEAEDALFKTAFNDAILDVQTSDIDLIINEMMSALYKTKEFNYSLYAERLFTALRSHQREIVSYSPDENTNKVDVTINLSPLGEIEMWGQAIEAVREAHDWGGTGDLASHMWKEKVYKPGREGSTVTNSKGEDVTERYTDLYEQTIAERLSLISEQYAPFWYIIEHGNTSLENFPDHEGTAYPIVAPTNVADEIQKTLERKFRDTIRDYIAEAERLYSSLLHDDFGVTGYSDTFKDFLDDTKKDVGEIFDKERLIETPKFKTIETVERNGKIYEVHKTRSGRLGFRYSLRGNR